MNTLQVFELTKNFIKKIRNEKARGKISPGTTLFINADKFIDKDELNSILHFDSIVKKLCKLETIIYICKVEDENVAFVKK
jgi:valyl-tRNA synthetase